MISVFQIIEFYLCDSVLLLIYWKWNRYFDYPRYKKIDGVVSAFTNGDSRAYMHWKNKYEALKAKSSYRTDYE